MFHTDGSGHVVGDVRPQDVVDTSGTGVTNGARFSGIPQSDTGTGATGGITSHTGNGGAGADTDNVGHDALDGGTGVTCSGGSGGSDDTASHSGTDTSGTATANANSSDGNPIIGIGSYLVGHTGDDVINGSADTSVIHADSGNDIVTTGDHGVVVDAGDDNDLVTGGAGADVVFGGGGDDIIDTGSGNDKIWGGDGNDLIKAGDGDDLIWAGDGDNEVHGGAGDDRVEVGKGIDIIYGDSGNDTFVFRAAADANGDTIADFQAGDKIDLHFIDADTSTAANDAFQIASGTTFSGAGQLIIHFDSGSNETIVDGNTDSHLDTVEFHLAVQGNVVDQLKAGLIV